MKFSVAFAFAMGALLTISGPSHAQYYGYGYPVIETHASTAEEGIANGMANIIASAGAANLMNAQAATEAEKARNEYIRNRLLATQTYFDMRRVNEQYRKDTQGRPLSMEQYVRLARMEAPDRMSPSELDTLNGKIYWPPQLMVKEYASYREQLESLFQRRARGDLSTYAPIKSVSGEFLEALKRDIDKFAPQDYVRAKNFVESLGYEAGFAVR
jgi:hypothetical protein